MQEKYGFVYIWRDHKRKKYYIGSHWGHENDGYICSSNYMSKAYKRRSHDFKRRVLTSNISSREETFNEEYKWLQLINNDELGKKYYNFTKHKNSHWTLNKEKHLSIKEKISIKTKEAMQKPEIKQKHALAMKKKYETYTQSEETKRKRGASISKTLAEKFPIENRWKKLSEVERKEYYSNKAKENWNKPGFKEKTSKAISESLAASKEQRSKAMSSMKWYNNGLINIRRQESPGEEWSLGRLQKNNGKKPVLQ